MRCLECSWDGLDFHGVRGQYTIECVVSISLSIYRKGGQLECILAFISECHRYNQIWSKWLHEHLIFSAQQVFQKTIVRCFIFKLFCTSLTSTGWLAAIWLKECSKRENDMVVNCTLLNNEYYCFTLAQIWKHSGHCVCFFECPKS